MHWLRNLPIRLKLICICLLTSGSVLLMACAAFLTHEQLTFRQSMTRDLSVTADMIALNSTAALSFGDQAAAEQNLHALNAHPHIVAACIFDPEGEVFASYLRSAGELPAWPDAQHPGEEFADDHLDLFRNIKFGGENLGVIYIRSNLDQMNDRLRHYAAIITIILLASILLAWLLAARLQRVISVPILHLASVASRVGDGTSTSIRAEKQSEDEIGRLTGSFNDMLVRIEKQNADLRSAHHHLEERVEQRTAELKRAQEEAALEHARFKFIFDSLPIGVAWMIRDKPDSRIVNPAFARITNVPLEHAHELKRYREMTHPDDRIKQTKLQQKMLAGETDSYHMEKRYLRPDGTSYCWAEFTNCSLRNPDSDSVQELSTVVDISKRKEAERELATTHTQLLETSRQAGMAEVATSVLHNVGNVLNSVNVSATLVDELVRRSKSSSIAKLSNLLKQHEENLGAFFSESAQGRKIPAFLESLSEQIASEQRTLLNELKSLRSNVDHIKEIVAMQQNLAKAAGMTETLPVVDLVEDALNMSSAAFTRHDVVISRDYQSQAQVTVDRHKVLQILVNLLQNAKHACDEIDAPEKTVTVKVAHEKERVEISVIDNGVGIAPDQMSRIFSHGYTTRKTGHGFGLHSGALAAREIGGSLRVHSEGPGKGATFVLDLPAEPPEMDS